MRWSDPFERLSVGQRFESGERAVRDTDVIVFSALTGDWHPQHCDPEWAASSPFGERIAHEDGEGRHGRPFPLARRRT